MSYDITWSAQAIRHFRKLDKPLQERVAALVTSLADTPRPATARALTGMPGVLRVRTGDYRVLYSIDDGKQQVWIEDVLLAGRVRPMWRTRPLRGASRPTSRLTKVPLGML